MKKLSILFSFSFFIFAYPYSAFGQICLKFPCVVDSGGTGEVASAAIDNFLVQAAESRERIFVIARPAKQEKNTGTNLDRLCEAREYLLGRLSSSDGYKEYFDLQPVVFAEGPAVEGEGRLEFYLGSILYLTRLIKLNRKANLNCCGELTPTERNRKHSECRAWKMGTGLQ